MKTDSFQFGRIRYFQLAEYSNCFKNKAGLQLCIVEKLKLKM